MKTWKCKVCGHIHKDDNPPEKCPVCQASSDEFQLEAGQENAQEDTQAIQQVLFNCSYGLYVITSVMGDKINGMTSNSFVQMTDTPLQAVVGINKNNYTSEFILDSGVFAVNFLATDNHDEVRRFGYSSGRDVDKFKRAQYTSSKILNLPVLTNAIGYVECEVQKDKCVDLGTHNLFVVKVIGGEVFNKKEPMTYAYFRATK